MQYSNGEVNDMWTQMCKAANIVEIIAEDGNRMERCQFIDDNGSVTADIIRVWRKKEPISLEVKECLSLSLP